MSGERARGMKRARAIFGAELVKRALDANEDDVESVTQELVDEVRKRTYSGEMGFRSWVLSQSTARVNAIIRVVSGHWVANELGLL